jgi:glycine cleavage system H protein
MIPDDRKYSQEHEWIQVDGDVVVIGVTDHAAGELGDVVYVDLPDVGAEFSAGDAVGSIESVKAVADLYSPVSGEVVEINDALDGDPGQVNKSPFDDGWMFKMRLADPGELDNLLDAAGYENLIGG